MGLQNLLDMTTVLLLGLIQSIYDYTGWAGIFKENDQHPKRLYFRVVKEILDFIVVPLIAFYWFDVSIVTLAAFFIAKWFHLCDSFYNIWSFVIKNQGVSEWGYWRWWTPLGLLRTNFWGLQIIKGYTQADHTNKTGAFYIKPTLMANFLKKKQMTVSINGFVRGMVSISEAWFQTGLGILLAFLLLWLVG